MACRIRFGPRDYRGIERCQLGDFSSALSYSADTIPRIYLANCCGILAAENRRLRGHREIMIGVLWFEPDWQLRRSRIFSCIVSGLRRIVGCRSNRFTSSLSVIVAPTDQIRWRD